MRPINRLLTRVLAGALLTLPVTLSAADLRATGYKSPLSAKQNTRDRQRYIVRLEAAPVAL
jgi:hypothetical protein